MLPIFGILQGCHRLQEAAEGCPGPCRTAPGTLQPLAGTPALSSPLWDVTLGSAGREAMKTAGAGRLFSGRPAAGREKCIPFICFASACFRAGLQRELAWSTPSAGLAI